MKLYLQLQVWKYAKGSSYNFFNLYSRYANII